MDCTAPFEMEVTVSGTVILSPNHPNLYENNIDCQTEIRFQSGQTILLEFLRFDIRTINSLCDDQYSDDWLEIRDDGSSSSPIRLCGTTTPTRYYSTGNELTLVFHSQGFGRGSGFTIRADLGKNYFIVHACSN